MKGLLNRLRAHVGTFSGKMVPRHGMGATGAVIVVLLVVWLLSVGLFYVWTRMQVVQIGYEIADLEKKNKALHERKRELLVEVASLESPGELESQARQKAGLVVPSMGKVVNVP